ncbi:N-terminal kinase-like protein isoform X2 [Babylonia areolata]|uniref:N-terminal kinase-like protein isoform X2 n=1 Tax=Babylonia areolata TaxID=304850 RepID=UPI003FD64B32
MWGLFSRDPTRDFNYDLGEKIPGLEDKSLWALHSGKKKGSGDPVSIFTFDVKAASESQVQTAKGAVKRLKTLRHPNILTFLDAVETDKVIYFATEPVVPLENYLQNNSDSHNETAISWGLHQILKGLSFLVNDCNLIHNNVCMASVFVDPAGEWKIGGVDYMYPAQGPDSIPPVKILPVLQKYDPPEKSDGARVVGNKWSADMWGLGCLIWEVFNGVLPRTAALKSLGKIPKILVPNYCELVGANPKSRPNPGRFLEECRKKGSFLNNSFVNSMLFLEEIQIKDQSEKNKFFSSLTPSLDSFPPQMCRNKILPQLLNAFEYGNAGSSVLAPMFKIGKHLDGEEYQRKIVPCVVKLFSSPDRSTRVNLLQQVEFFVEHLSSNVVNDQIFPNIASGFMDTNPVVRESTVKAMLHLASKLNYKNLNEELMKHFARLQSKDDQGGIRTNTTVCLGKIACHLNPGMRQKILVSAFMRALKDPFPPARQAGILAMAATQNFYHMQEIANRLLPSLCTMTRDPEKSVRDQAFKAIRGFLDKLEKLSEDPDLQEDMEREVMAGGSATAMSNASGWAGWAVTGMSSLTSKIYSKATTAKTKPAPSAGMETQPSTEPSKPDRDSSQASRVPPMSRDLGGDLPKSTAEEEGGGGGWDDEDWGDMDDMSQSLPTPSSGMGAEPANENEGWDNDDDWGSLEEPPANKPGSGGGMSLSSKAPSQPFDSWGDNDFVPDDTGMTSVSQYDWGSNDAEDDFFSSSVKPKKPQSRSTPPRSTSSRSTPSRDSPARSTASSASSATAREQFKPDATSGASGGGWVDSGGDGWGDDWAAIEDSVPGESEADRKKREREEKRLQRQRELQEKREARKGGGAMKLGAKKLG